MNDEMTFARALRRHHAARLKKARAEYWGGGEKSPLQLGLLLHTAAMCSCFACGNPRRYDGELTIAEQREYQLDIAELLADKLD